MAELVASVEEAKDEGRANRERWHWRVHLSDWVDEWLETNLKEHAFVETADLTLRVYAVRKTDGEALLHQRKGRTFCTFNLALDRVVRAAAARRPRARRVPRARARARARELRGKPATTRPARPAPTRPGGGAAAAAGGAAAAAGDDDENAAVAAAAAAPLEVVVEGDWEQCAPVPLSQFIARDPQPYELEIKQRVLAALHGDGGAGGARAGPPPLRARLELLRLGFERASRAGTATPRRRARSRRRRRAATPPARGRRPPARRAPGARARASAAEYVAALKKKHRSKAHRRRGRAGGGRRRARVEPAPREPRGRRRRRARRRDQGPRRRRVRGGAREARPLGQREAERLGRAAAPARARVRAAPSSRT